MGWGNWLLHKQVLLFPVTTAVCVHVCNDSDESITLLLNKPTALTHVSVFDSRPRNPLQAAHEDGPRLHLRWRVEVCERTV